MTQFKTMKMRINNPDHSKAVQQWLFDQGYSWGYQTEGFHNTEMPIIYAGTFMPGELGFGVEETFYLYHEGEEVDVNHLDPHLYHSSAVAALLPGHFHTEEKDKDPLKVLSTQLKQLDKAIDRHENKQQKRMTERKRVLDKIEAMLPEGYGIVLIGGVAEAEPVRDSAWERDVVVGSVWEFLRGSTATLTQGKHYKVTGKDGDGDPIFEDDDDYDIMSESIFLEEFKRVG